MPPSWSWSWSPSIPTASLLLPLFLLSACVHADIHYHDKDEGLYSFVTHPEIKAPRWTVNVTEPDLVTPGYWFLAPFEFIDQHEVGNGWVGPHIYDGNGELVWSGVEMVQNWDVIDFKMSNVRGEDLMTFLVQHDGYGYIMDNHYETREKVKVGTLGVDFNSHEFSFIENGTRAIILDEGRRDATKEQALALQYDKNCRCLFNGFKELDTQTWEPVFEWSSFEHIPLKDSTFLDGGVDRGCSDIWGWDFVHLNSVDKDQNGDYFVSARHTDSIYKVSKDDGHVMWRLHGRQEPEGEWDMAGLSFSRQHNVRFRGFNGTHEIISILDNASGQDEQKSTAAYSRGLVIALDVESRVARIISQIDHPYGDGSYAPRRGNYQVLPNDNVFVGWSEQATHSEHSPDGKLLMSASLLTQWLGTYRSYKFPFIGHPLTPPKAVSRAYASDARNSTTTMVHISWNGATEVDHYRLYKTTETGEPKIPIFQKEKTGFETVMAWDGYASYVVVECLDKYGQTMSFTEVIKTLEPPGEAMSDAVAEEIYWLQEVHGENDGWKSNPYEATYSQTAGGSFALILFGAVLAIACFFLTSRLRARGYLRDIRRPFQRYQALSDRDGDEEGDELGQGYPKRSQSGYRSAAS